MSSARLIDGTTLPNAAVSFSAVASLAAVPGVDFTFEWAARAGQTRAAQDHDQPKQANTWQGLFPVANSADDGFVGLAPAGCYPPNASGLFDMSDVLGLG